MVRLKKDNGGEKEDESGEQDEEQNVFPEPRENGQPTLEDVHRKKAAHARYMRFSRSLTSNKTPTEIRKMGLAAKGSTAKLSILMEQWFACEGHWSESTLLMQQRQEKRHGKLGARKCLPTALTEGRTAWDHFGTQAAPSKKKKLIIGFCPPFSGKLHPPGTPPPAAKVPPAAPSIKLSHEEERLYSRTLVRDLMIHPWRGLEDGRLPGRWAHIRCGLTHINHGGFSLSRPNSCGCCGLFFLAHGL